MVSFTLQVPDSFVVIDDFLTVQLPETVQVLVPVELVVTRVDAATLVEGASTVVFHVIVGDLAETTPGCGAAPATVPVAKARRLASPRAPHERRRAGAKKVSFHVTISTRCR
jgi:hypothetical protein